LKNRIKIIETNDSNNILNAFLRAQKINEFDNIDEAVKYNKNLKNFEKILNSYS